MESFLDEYQLLRLWLGAAGLILIGGFVIAGKGTGPMAAIALALGLTVSHSAWCRLRRIRSPRVMILSDMTMWGVVWFTLESYPLISTASLAFFTVLTVLFVDGVWLLSLLSYATVWYGASYFVTAGFSSESLANYLAVVLTVGGMGAIVFRLRGWLGTLDANRSQMLGTVSHELRNNLTGMLGLTAIVGSMDDLAPAEATELVALAHQQALDASDIVEDLLTATRLEGSAMSVQVAEVDLNAEVATTVRRFVGEGTSVTSALAETLPMAWADPLRTRQILRNLVSNAVRYGGPVIGLSTQFVGDESGGYCQVVVSDNGDGVPIEDEGSIFLPYRRSTATRGHAASVGLGLWICHQLASNMGGAIEYRRTDGLTEFVLTLPTGPKRAAPIPRQLLDRLRERQQRAA
jgi:signal transduction histidine kinase